MFSSICSAVSVICLCFSLFLLYMVLFFNVRLEERPSFRSLFRLQGLFLLSIVVVVVVVVVAVVVRFLNMSSGVL